MSYEHKEGSGSLFKNGYKQKESHPDYKGEVKINGVLMDIAGWVKEGKNGKFFSLKVSEKRERHERKGEMPEADSEIPF